MKIRVYVVLFVMFSVAAFPATAQTALQIVPLARYDMLATPDVTVHAPSAGVLLAAPATIFVGTYGIESVESRRFHAAELLVDHASRRARYVGAFSTRSDEPVTGGWNTVQAAAVAGYQLAHGDRGSFTLGGGLAVGDFGITTSQGAVWPLLPVPFIAASYTGEFFSASFDFITGPNVNLLVGREDALHVVADARMDQFRDLRDLVFDAALMFRMLGLGVANTTYSYDRAGSPETQEVGAWTAFARVDITLASLTAGYVIDSWTRRDDTTSNFAGGGFYLAVEAMLPLGGDRE